MGKAAVELPDPLASPAEAGKPLTSTDDLLAQLAGEEIDRLLAEVEEPATRGPEPAPVSAPPPVAVPEAPPAPEPTIEPEAAVHAIDLAGTPDAPPSPSGSPEPAVPTPPAEDAPLLAAAAAAAQPELTEELDAFFKTAVKAPEEGAKVAVAPELSETSAAERAGLNTPDVEPAAGSAAAIKGGHRVPDGAEAGGDEPLPLLLKPLEWINAPLEACPPGLRDLIGKVAIVTLANAAAVLAYVLLFRRH